MEVVPIDLIHTIFHTLQSRTMATYSSIWTEWNKNTVHDNNQQPYKITRWTRQNNNNSKRSKNHSLSPVNQSYGLSNDCYHSITTAMTLTRLLDYVCLAIRIIPLRFFCTFPYFLQMIIIGCSKTKLAATSIRQWKKKWKVHYKMKLICILSGRLFFCLFLFPSNFFLTVSFLAYRAFVVV